MDISNAFDTVNHYKLYAYLINSGIPKWILDVIINWYCKLLVAVSWKTALFNIVYVSSGVRQGSSLLPALFTLFVNMFIVKMRELNTGCCVNGTFVGCIMYVDDVIVLSASVSGPQSLLDCCYQVSITLMLKFNCLKSSCSVVGPPSKLNISKMQLGSVIIEWTSSFKYLGVVFIAGRKLSVYTDAIKRKFYTACNCLLGNTYSLMNAY